MSTAFVPPTACLPGGFVPHRPTSDLWPSTRSNRSGRSLATSCSSTTSSTASPAGQCSSTAAFTSGDSTRKQAATLSETVLGQRDVETGKPLQDYVSWLNMPTALPDILSSDGRYVYMRSQPFRLDGTRLPLQRSPRGADADQGAVPAVQNPDFAHLFSPTGFCDDSYWHRSYWLYGSTFVSGWSGYYRAGKTAPAGKILCFDESGVYGFGRQPKYFRWSTPIEYQLFAARKAFVPPRKPTAGGAKQSLVRIAKSKTLNPANTPLSVAVWVKTNASRGVIVAHGGGAQGYALYLKDRRPRFTLRVGGRQSTATSRTPVTNRWVHLVGVLTPQKELKIFVDGKLAGTAKASGLITQDPTESDGNRC